jgi:hypothetical protein
MARMPGTAILKKLLEELISITLELGTFPRVSYVVRIPPRGRQLSSFAL